MPARSNGISGTAAEGSRGPGPKRLLLFLLAAVLLPAAARAQDDEDFRVEASAGDWLLHTQGTIQSGGVPLDLRSDLGVEQNTSTFYGKLVLKPARRHRIVVEGVPYRLSGASTLTRSFTYAGRTYLLREDATSSAEINSVFGGYQYDIVSRERGHFGVLGGAAYLDAAGSVTVPARNLTGAESRQAGLPLAGVEFRGWVTPGINLNGGVKGMSIGRFGHYVQAELHLGIRLARWVTLQAGYTLLDTEVHNSGGTVAFNPQFSGPVLSLQFRDR